MCVYVSRADCDSAPCVTVPPAAAILSAAELCEQADGVKGSSSNNEGGGKERKKEKKSFTEAWIPL